MSALPTLTPFRPSPCRCIADVTDGCIRADLHDIPYTSRYDVQVDLPKYKLPEQGCDAKVAYQLLHDELILGEFRPPAYLNV